MKHILLALFCQILFLCVGWAVGEACPDSDSRTTFGEEAGNADVSTFASLAQTAEALNILDSTDGRYHIFAPSDDVLKVYLEEFPEVGSDGEQALSLLTYHIVENESCEPLNGSGYSTLLEKDGSVLDVSESTVVDPNGYSATITAKYPLKNGYLYVIDNILSPVLSK